MNITTTATTEPMGTWNQKPCRHARMLAMGDYPQDRDCPYAGEDDQAVAAANRDREMMVKGAELAFIEVLRQGTQMFYEGGAVNQPGFHAARVVDFYLNQPA